MHLLAKELLALKDAIGEAHGTLARLTRDLARLSLEINLDSGELRQAHTARKELQESFPEHQDTIDAIETWIRTMRCAVADHVRRVRRNQHRVDFLKALADEYERRLRLMEVRLRAAPPQLSPGPAVTGRTATVAGVGPPPHTSPAGGSSEEGGGASPPEPGEVPAGQATSMDSSAMMEHLARRALRRQERSAPGQGGQLVPITAARGEEQDDPSAEEGTGGETKTLVGLGPSPPPPLSQPVQLSEEVQRLVDQVAVLRQRVVNMRRTAAENGQRLKELESILNERRIEINAKTSLHLLIDDQLDTLLEEQIDALEEHHGRFSERAGRSAHLVKLLRYALHRVQESEDEQPRSPAGASTGRVTNGFNEVATNSHRPADDLLDALRTAVAPPSEAHATPRRRSRRPSTRIPIYDTLSKEELNREITVMIRQIVEGKVLQPIPIRPAGQGDEPGWPEQ